MEERLKNALNIITAIIIAALVLWLYIAKGWVLPTLAVFAWCVVALELGVRVMQVWDDFEELFQRALIVLVIAAVGGILVFFLMRSLPQYTEVLGIRHLFYVIPVVPYAFWRVPD